MSQGSLLTVRDLQKTYTVRTLTEQYTVCALQSVSFDVGRDEILGIAGESGSGKSTLAKILVRLVSPDRGTLRYSNEISHFRKQVQMIFQNPYASLNPLMTIGTMLREVIRVHKLDTRQSADVLIKAILSAVELDDEIRLRVPLQLSGGQRQRAAIARSLLLEPRLLICDEIISSLDYPTGYKIIQMLMRLRQKQPMSILFITHNIQLLSMFATRIAVFYKGYLVEIGAAEVLVNDPLHPYTAELIKAASYAELSRLSPLRREQPVDPDFAGCPYAMRCDTAHDQCRKPVALIEARAGHWVRCCKAAFHWSPHR